MECVNIFIIGGIGMGKIMLFLVLLLEVFLGECIVMIEDVVELCLWYFYYVVFEVR